MNKCIVIHSLGQIKKALFRQESTKGDVNKIKTIAKVFSYAIRSCCKSSQRRTKTIAYLCLFLKQPKSEPIDKTKLHLGNVKKSIKNKTWFFDKKIVKSYIDCATYNILADLCQCCKKSITKKTVQSKKSKWRFNFKQLLASYLIAMAIIFAMALYWPKYEQNREKQCNVKARQLLTRKTTNGDLLNLSKLTYTTKLSLGNTRISDAGLVYLKSLKNLSMLSLKNAKISDAGLVHLRPLKNLSMLSLKNTKISDAGLVHLRSLKNLSILSLGNTKISDLGLVHLRPLKNLSILSLENTKISDLGLVHLRPLKNLSILSLKNTKISDLGLAHLASLENLSRLNLGGTRISDVGLVHLKSLINLSRLSFYQTRITKEAAAKLQKALPQCIIWID